MKGERGLPTPSAEALKVKRGRTVTIRPVRPRAYVYPNIVIAEPTMDRSDIDAAGVEKVPLAEEHAQFEKHRVVTGKVRVHTVVDVLDQPISEELTAERIAVQRVPINRYVEVAPGIRNEGELTIIPVLEEVLVVERKLLLKEEIHVQRTVTKETVSQTVPVRKQRAVIESEGPET